MTVIIGVDQHKASHTAVAVSTTEVELARTRVRSGGASSRSTSSTSSPAATSCWDKRYPRPPADSIAQVLFVKGFATTRASIALSVVV